MLLGDNIVEIFLLLSSYCLGTGVFQGLLMKIIILLITTFSYNSSGYTASINKNFFCTTLMPNRDIICLIIISRSIINFFFFLYNQHKLFFPLAIWSIWQIC